MRSRRRRGFWGSGAQVCAALLILSAGVWSPAPASATVVEELSLEELTHQAVYVVRARVGAQYVHPERGPRGEIYTRTELTALGYLKGEGPRRLTVQQLGGRFGPYRMQISGNAPLRTGDEVVLFLDHDPASGLSYVVGLSQGLYRVNRTAASEWVERELDGLSFYTAGAVPYGLPTFVQGLAELELRIRATFDMAPDDGPEGVRR